MTTLYPLPPLTGKEIGTLIDALNVMIGAYETSYNDMEYEKELCRKLEVHVTMKGIRL